MTRLRPEEVSLALKQELERYRSQVRLDSTGRVIQVGDGIARLYGLDDVMAGELLEFPGPARRGADGGASQTLGMVFNLEEHHVGAVILGSDQHIKTGISSSARGASPKSRSARPSWAAWSMRSAARSTIKGRL